MRRVAESLDRRVTQDRKARLAHKAPKVFLVLKERPVHKGHREGRKATREIRGDRGTVTIRAVQADGAANCDSSETL